jgi:osmoprotectant transport system substrate-binding protein
MTRITRHRITRTRITHQGIASARTKSAPPAARSVLRAPARAAALGLAAVTGLTLTACGGSSSNPLNTSSSKGSGSVVVGSGNFPESELLAEIFAQELTAKGIKVTRQFNIGTREVYYPELAKGAITVVPEYNGSLLSYLNPSSTAATTAQVNSALAAKLPSSVEALQASSAQDSDSVTVTAATAAQDHLKSIADLAPYAKNMTFGGPAEFKTRADGIVGLHKNYGLTFKGFDPLDESGPITIAALQNGKVQAADLFTTTPQVITDHFVVLSDPKNNFAAQNVIPVVDRKAVNSTAVNALNAVSAKLTTASLLQMDKQIGVDHAAYATVAKSWLSQNGLG